MENQPPKAHKTLKVVLGIVLVLVVIGWIGGAKDEQSAATSPGYSASPSYEEASAAPTSSVGSESYEQGWSIASSWPTESCERIVELIVGGTIAGGGTVTSDDDEALNGLRDGCNAWHQANG